MFKKLQDKIDKKIYGETMEEMRERITEEEANWVPEDLISFKGKNISIVKFSDLENWEDLDDLLSMGYEILAAPSHGGEFHSGTYSYLVLKNPPEKQ